MRCQTRLLPSSSSPSWQSDDHHLEGSEWKVIDWEQKVQHDDQKGRRDERIAPRWSRAFHFQLCDIQTSQHMGSSLSSPIIHSFTLLKLFSFRSAHNFNFLLVASSQTSACDTRHPVCPHDADADDCPLT